MVNFEQDPVLLSGSEHHQIVSLSSSRLCHHSFWNPSQLRPPCVVWRREEFTPVVYLILFHVLDASTGNSWFGELSFQEQWRDQHNQRAVICSDTAKGARQFCLMSSSHKHSHAAGSPVSTTHPPTHRKTLLWSWCLQTRQDFHVELTAKECISSSSATKEIKDLHQPDS